MLEALLSVLGNSHFEAYVAGPLIGVIAACVFSALGTRPPSGGIESDITPQEARNRIAQNRVQQRSDIGREVHHHHYHGDRGKSTDDGIPLLVATGAVSLVAMFLFAAFLPQIAFSLYCFISGVAMFSMTASLLAWITGQFNTIDWWQHSVFPFFASLGCFWIVIEANQAISPDVVAFARRLLGENPWSIRAVLGGAITFFRFLGDRYVHWMLFDMLAFILVTICALVTLLQCLYYVALSNTRAGGGSGWRSLAIRTEGFSGKGTLIFVSILLLSAWFLATGSVYRLIHQ